MSTPVSIFAFAGALLIVCLTVWAGNRLTPESSPVARGAAYAQPKGCVDCHGDPDNPLVDENDGVCSNANSIAGHPDYNAACADVIAYFEAVRLRRNFAERARNNSGNPLIAGEQLAREYHCFQCHGDLGQGGFENAKSLKGYVPGYFGTDFKLLTANADPASVRRWLLHGMDTALLDPPVTGRIAAFFFARQAVNMPSYKSLAPGEIDVLVSYVIAINRLGPMSAASLRDYDVLSRSSVIAKDQRNRSAYFSAR